MAKVIEKAVSRRDGIIYYVIGNEEEKINVLEVDFLQFLLPEDKVEVINICELNNKVRDNDIIVVNLDSSIKGIIERWYDPVITSRNFGLFCEDRFKSGINEGIKELQEYSIKIPLSQMKSVNNIVENKTIFQSNGTEDCLLYGPYMQFFSGKYRIEFDLECKEWSDEYLGKLQVTANSGNDILKEKEVTIKSFNIGKSSNFY